MSKIGWRYIFACYKNSPGSEILWALDFSDDRLQAVLRYLNQDENWARYEQAQGQHLIQVYALPQETVRLDTTTASTYQDANPQGLVQPGMSKDHRPDLAQLKIMLGTLDPLRRLFMAMPNPRQSLRQSSGLGQ